MTYMELSLEQRQEALQRFERCVTWDPSAFAYTVDRAGHVDTMKRRRPAATSDRICGQCLGIIPDDSRDCPACNQGVAPA